MSSNASKIKEITFAMTDLVKNKRRINDYLIQNSKRTSKRIMISGNNINRYIQKSKISEMTSFLVLMEISMIISKERRLIKGYLLFFRNLLFLDQPNLHFFSPSPINFILILPIPLISNRTIILVYLEL